MLQFEMKDDILTVKEDSDFRGNRRQVEYNINTWESRITETKYKEIVYQEPWYKMNDSSIAWVKKYYIPKVSK